MGKEKESDDPVMSDPVKFVEFYSKKKCRFLTPEEKFKFLEKHFKTALGQFELETCIKASELGSALTKTLYGIK
ncbi:MAG: hypothetical protein LBQ01_00970 [Prevotellaceae bacterium]|jgi:hypothetical protein|nr:hypothetical protein [Prevotellaceae bacterium]